jgi:hypothetical protein
MSIRAAVIASAAAAMLASGCMKQVDGQAVRAPDGPPPGVLDVDQIVLGIEQMRAITGAGQDLMAVPGMDGKALVDVDELAEQVPRECRFVFSDTATFGTAVAGFRKISFQNPPAGVLITEGAAAYVGPAEAARAFNALQTTVTGCAGTAYGAVLVGQWNAEAESLSMRLGDCGRDYRLKSSVLVEVTFCGLPEATTSIVIANILTRIAAR